MIQSRTFLAIIPARGGSKGVRFKNIRKVTKNDTLLDLTYSFASKCNFIDKIIISTDHKKIVNECINNNYNYIIRPKSLSKDHVSAYRVIENVIKTTKKKFDYIIYLEPTSPFRKKKDLKKSCLEIVKQKKYSCWSVNKVSKKYHPKKLLINSKGNLKLYEKNGEKIIARQQLGEIFQRNGIFYIFNTQQLLKEKKIYLKKTIFFEINYPYVNIDTIEDLKNTKKLAKKFKFND
jgi:CMP-N,N'-diacetyllegionaminic acid synthase